MSALVTGMGCISALGADMAACIDALFAKEGSAPDIPSRFTTGHQRIYPVFELPAQVVQALPLDENTLLTARLAWAAAAAAIDQAGVAHLAEDAPRLRVGVCVGTTVGSAMNNEAFYRSYRDPQGSAPDMGAIQRYLASNPAEVVANALRRKCSRVEVTLVQTVCNACSSGADAIGIAAGWVRGGLCDVALAGGTDELCRVTLNGFASLMIHSQEPCRPFDAARAGLNLGEGAAMLVLEREESALQRGATGLGQVLGYGARCDAHHLTAPHPEGRGLRAALDEALGFAGVEKRDIAFVNAHGTGTKDNDRVEGKVLADCLPGIPFFSSKGRTGHTLGAAGAIEAALTLACLQKGRIPASFGCKTPDPDVPAVPCLQEQPVQGRAALSFSLAFGGSNAVLALGV